MSVKKLRKSQKSERQAEVQVKEGHEIGQSLSMIGPYLIFVISFTQAKFRRIKFTPKNMYTKGVNCQIITQKSINFAFILGKFTLDRKNLHWHRRWCR